MATGWVSLHKVPSSVLTQLLPSFLSSAFMLFAEGGWWLLFKGDRRTPLYQETAEELGGGSGHRQENGWGEVGQ